MKSKKYEIKEVQKIWKDVSKGNQSTHDLHIDLEIQKKLLTIFQVGDYYYMITNVPETKFDFVSPQTEKVLGIKPEDFTIENLFARVHPEDQPYVLNFESAIGSFFTRLSTEKMLLYKARYDYRVQKNDGEYIRILQQVVVLGYEEGALLSTLCVHTDITHLKELGKPVLSIIGLDDEPSYVNIDVEQKYIHSSFLSKREKEIIILLSNGRLSKEIGLELELSLATVETYRKNLLKKTDTINTPQLIAKVIREGWL